MTRTRNAGVVTLVLALADYQWVERIGLPKLLPRIDGVAAQLSK